MFGHTHELDLPALAGRFGVVPFTIFDAKTGQWLARKREWVNILRVKGEAGRDSNDGSIAANPADLIGKYGKPNDAVVPGGGGPNSVRRRAAGDVGNVFQRGNNEGAEGTKGLLGMSDSSMRIAGGYHTEDGEAKSTAGTSIFDPVLCEVGYRWFCPKGGSILDPFAGGSTRGLVASWLGYQYTGIELRQGQVEANRAQFAEIAEKHALVYANEIAAGTTQPMQMPNWIVGDSSDIDELLPFCEEYDLCFSCPPYYDLEMYKGGEGDGSAKKTYAEFLVWYENIYRQCAARLKPNRFMIITVGDIRDDDGFYRGFVPDTYATMAKLPGLRYYNEAILVTAIGSLPVRISAQFPKYRKLGKTHQNVLMFWKGDDDHAILTELGRLDNVDFDPNAAQPKEG